MTARTIQADRSLWWLTVYDPETGLATRVVGVVGTEGTDRCLAWMPLEPAIGIWAQALADADVADLANLVAVDVAAAVDLADGVIVGLVEIDDPPPSVDLAGAVAAAIDRAVIADVEWDKR